MAVLITASLALAFIYIYTDWLKPIRNYANDLVYPVYWVVNLPERVGGWVHEQFSGRQKLMRENEALQSELLVHKRKLQQLVFLAAENERLRRLMNAAETLEDRVLVAELVGVSPDPTVHRVIINKGTSDGVYLGQPLVDAEGLMGQVVEVGQYTSKVLLVTDATHALPVLINRNGVRLVAEGFGDLYRLALRYVPNTLDIQEGDLLVTSGLGQRFPVGYPVAKVVEVKQNSGRPFADVIAKPMAQLNRSRHVLLVFDTSKFIGDDLSFRLNTTASP